MKKMTITKALNYMKTIIYNGMKNGHNSENVQKGLIDYLSVLYGEGVIYEKQYNILSGVVSMTADIMSSKMSVDEAFVRAMCESQNEKYVEAYVNPNPKKESSSKGSTEKKIESKSKSKPKSKPVYYEPKCDGSGLPKDGSCGGRHEIQVQLMKKRERERRMRGCDGIWSKCR